MKKPKVKSFLVIGMGRFGRHLARRLQELGNSVMVVDKRENLEHDISFIFEDYLIGDCTNETVLGALGIGNFDICFVTIGKNFESSIIITSLLKNFGAQYIVTRASRDIQTDVLRKIGADQIIYPEREFAEKLAIRYNVNHIFDYFELSDNVSIFEIAVPTEWIGRNIGTLNVRQKCHVNILAVKNGADVLPMPDAAYKFRQGDIIVVMGKGDDVFCLTSQ
ncbi:MAG: TrkA family potassium uptake protein [Tannerella sp.]|jgi:trk system potassium uptake protein TrkA|nr:TrkA family potassium uptake protein [Tannerella sp.]